jgi:hypothetical protein
MRVLKNPESSIAAGRFLIKRESREQRTMSSEQ